MRLTSPRLRRAALLCAGAWTVHELRFAIAPVHGGDGPGHAYLGAAVPALVALMVLAVAGFALRLAAPRDDEPMRPLVRDWLSGSGLLLGAFVAQEGAEALSNAHTAGASGGAWVAAPLALAVGLLVALALRGARAATSAAAPTRLLAPVVAPIASVFPLHVRRRWATGPQRHLAARPPPGTPVRQP